MDERTAEQAYTVAEAFGLDDRTRDRLAAADVSPVFEDFGRYIHVTTYAPEEDTCELVPVECVVGDHWVVTAHERPIPVLDDFKKRVSGSGDTGTLDGPAFLAALLEWVLSAYSAAFEHLEHASRSSTSEPCGATAGRGHRTARDNAAGPGL